MPRPPYKYFTPLNNRRHALIRKEHRGGGLTDLEARELKMLTRIVDAMIDYRYPMVEGSLEELEALVERAEKEAKKC